MLKIPYKYGTRSFLLSPYNTIQEKEILLLVSLDILELDRALAICGISEEVLETLSEYEKKAILYKFRSISVGEEVNIRYKCPNCKTVNEPAIQIDNILTDPKIEHKFIDQYQELNDENFNLFLGYNSDDLELDEYDKLFEECKKSIINFNFIKKCTCNKCKEEKLIDISNTKFILENMSEDTLISLYQLISDMVFHGKYTKADIDNMLPFERSILVGLLNKTREEMNS